MHLRRRSMYLRRRTLRLIGLPPLVALVAGLLGGAADASTTRAAGQIDVRGVWDAPSHVGATSYPQQWHITSENLATGAYSGVDTSPVGSFSLSGTVSGSRISTVASESGYTSHGVGTISGSGLALKVTGTFTDTNGTKGTYVATRLSAPSSKPPTSTTPATTTPGSTPPDQSQVCLPDCAQGAEVTYDSSLDPGQTTDTTTASCGSSRSTSSAAAASGLLCSIGDIVKDAAGDALNPLGLSAEMQKGLNDIFNQAPMSTNPDMQAVQNLLKNVLDATQTQQQIQQQQQQINEILQQAIDGLQSNESSATDSALAPDFPSDDRGTASARAPALASHALASTSLVLQSIASEHPSAAAGNAFKSDMKLATSSTYSTARAKARLTLAVALLFGRHALAADHLGSSITIAQGKITVPEHKKRTLVLRASPLGARFLRLLQIEGLRHRVSIRIAISSTRNGKTSHATRSIRVA